MKQTFYTALEIKKEASTVDEEVVLLEEQLSAAQSDIEQLQSRLADAETRLQERVEEVTALRSEIASRDEALSTRSGEVDSLREALSESQGQAREAAQRYRQLIIEGQPDLPQDLVTGETVEDVDAAVSRARQTVAQVRQHLEEQAQSLRVPAGAPQRSAADSSELSAGEKIRLGLSRE